jgi:hypothetical protein
MLFRMPDGEIAEVTRRDYSTKEEYCSAIMEAYGVRLPPQSVATSCDDESQLDMVYDLMMKFQPSRL